MSRTEDCFRGSIFVMADIKLYRNIMAEIIYIFSQATFQSLHFLNISKFQEWKRVNFYI